MRVCMPPIRKSSFSSFRQHACAIWRENTSISASGMETEFGPGLKATHLIEEVCFPVATPTLAKEWRQAGWEGFRSKARIIVNGTHPDEWSVWCAHSGWIRPDQRRGSTLESFDFVLQAGLAGAGLIMGRRPMVDDYLTRGELEAPFGTVGMVGKSYFLVWPADRLPNVRTRAVIDWLLDCAAKTAEA